MNKSALVAIILAGLMISSSVLVIATSVKPTVQKVNRSRDMVLPVTESSANLTNFTIYVPSSTFSSSVIRSELNSNGIYPKIGGNLWTFSVPSKYSRQVNSLLGNLSAEFHSSYFSSIKNPLAYPAVQTMSTPKSGNIPFAYTPNLISRAYNFTWALNHGINGKGQTIVIVDAFGDPNLAYDIKAFDSVNSLPKANITIDYPFGTPGEYNSTWAMETATDVEWAHALAPGAKIVLLVATAAYTNNLQQMVSYAVQNRVGNIISLSWGTPESQLNSNIISTYSKVYADAASLGMDVFAASGDQGAYLGTSQLTVSFPSSDPWVTGVGGTSLYVINNQFHQYGWGGMNNGESYGSGGGYSKFFQTPYWQNATGYKGTMRGAPDVAMDADKYTGVYVIANGGQYTIGGTSVSTPMWADVAALMRQYTNTSLPSINPLLYQIARSPFYTSSFSQIVTGTNGYYNNTAGWNPVTGLGTPLVSGLLNVSKNLLKGYGANVLFNGPENYNATSIMGSLSLSTVTGNLDRNGSTFYYLGFYSGNSSSMKFGVLKNYSGMQLLLEVEQNGKTVSRYFQMPSGIGPDLSGFLIEFSYTGTLVEIHTSGGFQYSMPVFLDYSGNMVPASGVKQLNSETNLTMINHASFSDIRTFNGTKWSNVSEVYYEPYSSFISPQFSSIGASFSSNTLEFYSSLSQKSRYINGSGSNIPEIQYNTTYGYPLKASFSLPGITTPTWYINGSKITGQTFSIPVSGGSFRVNASFKDKFDTLINISRTVNFPAMSSASVSLNYSIPGYTTVPYTTVTSMWFYSSVYSPGYMIPMINSTNVLSLYSKGFKPVTASLAPTDNISLNLSPERVNATIFVFNGNSTVKIGGNNITGQNGYFYDNILPTTNLEVNVSSPGFMDFNSTYLISPGVNFTEQIILEPTDLNDSIISGTVTDYLYSFPVNDASVSLYNLTYSYTNSTGFYTLFAKKGNYTVNAGAPLYDNYSTPLNITSNSILNLQLKPSKVSVQSTTPVNITHYFPLLFYFGFVSWNQYRGANFSVYQIYVSKQPDFLNPNVKTITSQSTTYTFLTGIVPGQTYYVSIVLQLSNGQVYQSQVIKISYDNALDLAINSLLVGAIGLYAFIAYRVFRKK